MPQLKREQLTDFAARGMPAIGAMPVRKTTDIASSKIGVCFETLNRFMFDPERVYPLMAELGSKWARVQTGWNRCEVEPGKYDFAWLEELVDKLLAVGVEPFFSVSFGNKLYMPDVPHESAVGHVPLYYGDSVRVAWDNYVRALADCFRGRVRHWKVWNEPNLQNMHDLVRRLLKQYSGGKVIDVWQGENGCPSQTEGHNDDWLGLYATDQVVQAKWVARRILVDLKTGFDMALYFHVIDLMGRPYRQAGGEEKMPVMMGLINGATYEPKYSFEVFQRVCSLFDDASERRELFYRFMNPDEKNPQQSAILATPMAVSFVRDGVPFGEPFICDDANVGTRFRLPLTDYPLVLTDRSLFPFVT